MPRWANESVYDSQVLEAVRANGLEVKLVPVVKGMIATESGFVPSAQRAEPSYRCPLDGTVGDASRGLMQILYCTARGIGYTGPASGLFEPTTNLQWGVKYLAQLLRSKGGDLWAAVSAYNNGNGKKATSVTQVCLARGANGECVTYFTAQPGQFFNQPYVDKVQAAAAYFGWSDAPPAPPPNVPPPVTPPPTTPPATPPVSGGGLSPDNAALLLVAGAVLVGALTS